MVFSWAFLHIATAMDRLPMPFSPSPRTRGREASPPSQTAVVQPCFGELACDTKRRRLWLLFDVGELTTYYR